MKILFISNLYPPNVVGGYERLCFEVASSFAELGDEVTVLTSSYGRASAVNYPGQTVLRRLRLLVEDDSIYVTIRDPDRISESIRENLAELQRALTETDPDVVFVWNLYFLDRSFLDALIMSHYCVVFELTDNWLAAFDRPEYIGRYFEQLLRSTKLKSLSGLGRVANTVRNLLAGGESVAMPQRAIFSSRFMQRFYHDAGIAFRREAVIYHGVKALAGPTPDDRSSLRQQGQVRILAAGRVVAVKGLHTVVEALPAVVAGVRDATVSLTILGDTSDREYLESLKEEIRVKHLEGNVNFESAVDIGDLAEVFAHHDILVFPSLYEPYSLTLLHALQQGIPVICSDAGGNKEVVRNGSNGWVFPKGDSGRLATAIVNAVQNHAARLEISQTARAMARNYTYDEMLVKVKSQLDAWSAI
ncbi:MAG: glycosyltransferase family 4 protein [Sulfobacillus sp.]